MRCPQDLKKDTKLPDNELRYLQLFNSMKGGFSLYEIICDDNGKPVDYRFIEVNPDFEKLTGFSAANIIGKTVKQIIPNIEQFCIER